MALILVSSCRKSEVTPAADFPNVANTETDAVRVETPDAKGNDATMENGRMRPRPRPPEVKKDPPVQYPIAVVLDGRPGFVTSPYNGQVIDLRDIPPGTLVQDPSFPAVDKKYFRVP
ncbi:MAG: hypothetical protein ABI073_06910 [Luteolibacter sp.]